ncbi:hypothetical protein E2562_033458 [Oryza meyeriana var. granulata]|uniref:Uncharacterized protein n=1 Tax=Oryza meyeriana var. granulata TaxID=110450 RepID=A0A6G1E6H0_9ORYZ|nr:hypothetical protein E2562_033458 [Oryza meyeriana var. granulata]
MACEYVQVHLYSGVIVFAASSPACLVGVPAIVARALPARYNDESKSRQHGDVYFKNVLLL